MNKTRGLLLAAGIALAMAFTFSCSSDDGPDDPPLPGGSSSSGGGGGGVVPGTPVTHGGETYQTVVIGTQTWFARNLNYNPGTGNSACYSDQASNCATYGRLYDWSTAMALPSSCNGNSCSNQIQPEHKGICPAGWHVPSNADWDKLFRYVDDASGTSSPYSSETAGRYLKATSGWNDNGNGTDKYGFSALPGGFFSYLNGDFNGVGFNDIWWIASEINSNTADYRFVANDAEGAAWGSDNKSSLFSVRCVKDNGQGGGNPSSSSDGGVVNLSLDGTWKATSDWIEGTIVTITGNTGVFTQISNPSAFVLSALDKGYVSIGDIRFKELTKTGDLTWTGQYLGIRANSVNSNVAIGTSWNNITLTMSADGQTFQIRNYSSSLVSSTWTRISGGGNPSSSSGGGGNTFTDPRDGKVYATTTIGGLEWMAENLNYKASGSKCGGSEVEYITEDEVYYNLEDEDNVYCNAFGRLYDWATAVNACPVGWSLPSDELWDGLVGYAGGSAAKLKAEFSWFNPAGELSGGGSNNLGFSAMPGGLGYSTLYIGTFNFGYWWTGTTSEDGDEAVYRAMGYDDDGVLSILDTKEFLFSVRCVKNNG